MASSMHCESTFIIVELQTPGRRRVSTAIMMHDLLQLSRNEGMHKWNVNWNTSVAQTLSYTLASGVDVSIAIE
jgi:hypothetical protein